MAYAILVIALFAMAMLLLPRMATANPATLAAGTKRTFGSLVIAASAFLALRGLIYVAIPLFLFGLTLLGLQRGFAGSTRRSRGQASEVRTSMLHMSLDHDTGAMSGTVLKGTHAGASLSDMSLQDLLELYRECVAAKDQSDALLAAYLDRHHEGWRDHGGAGADGPSPGGGRMSYEDALDLLGLDETASADQIKAAHRKLMKKHHPDRGGSAWLAARINEAKDILLDVHGE